jgi:glucokinase
MYLGVEIGGSKLQLGVGGGDGTLAAHWRGRVDPAAGAAGIRRQIADALPELLARAGLERAQLQGAGIGFGGPVDGRTVVRSHQVPGWDGFPLAEWLEELVERPAALGNDADVAGLAEALFGAGQGLSPIFYITVGSGIGGGLIIDGQIYRGAGKGAAEIGHLRLDDDRTVEAVASGWAITQRTRFLVGEQPRPETQPLYHIVGGPMDQLTTVHVAEAARQGNALCRSVLEEAWDGLAEGICHVIALLCPKRIVIGGGVSLMGEELFFAPLRQAVARKVFPPFADCYAIVPAQLGEAVVVHGALALARQAPASYPP